MAIYIDNNAALAALINGDPSSHSASYPIATLRLIAETFDIALWFGRIESSRNIDDLPTSGGGPPFPVLKTDPNPPQIQAAIRYYYQLIATELFPHSGGSDRTPPTSLID